MDHFYRTIGEDWFSYSAFYTSLVERTESGGNIVEVGSWKGRSAAYMAVEIINSGKRIQLDCVDSWKYVPSTEQPVSSQEEFDSVYNEFMVNMIPVLREIPVIVFKTTSEDASRLYEDNSIDALFLDASHHYEDIKNDCTVWFPKIKPGGIISGHDYFTTVHPGVKRAVDEIFPDAQKIQEQNVWFYEKK